MARILFVDDDPNMLETLDRSAKLFGHQAMTADCGADALRLALTGAPDLIMTDMMLPDMDGLALLNRLRQDSTTASIPVVILSASPEVDLAQMSQLGGADSYLSKPVRLRTLQKVIERYTSGENHDDANTD
jgi:two-component system OmpR family response regulator